jgi:hypothetical protein
MLRKIHILAFGAAIAAAALFSPAQAQVQLTYPGGPLTTNGNGPPPPHHWRGMCRHGFVWRDAVDGDHVCVTPGTRQQAADDNAHAGARVSVHNQSYGADTCKQGYVWREATPDDHVCVTPGTRNQTADDNAHAGDRVVN